MKRFVMFALIACFAVLGVQARADGLNLNSTNVSKDPLTGLDQSSWITLAQTLVNGKAVVGKPYVFVINATGQELNSVLCDDRWQLVGPNPYIKGAPSVLPAWKVTIVPTEGFDGYCKTSIMGQSDNGVIYKAVLVSVDKTFTNATFITFRNPQ